MRYDCSTHFLINTSGYELKIRYRQTGVRYAARPGRITALISVPEIVRKKIVAAWKLQNEPLAMKQTVNAFYICKNSLQNFSTQ